MNYQKLTKDEIEYLNNERQKGKEERKKKRKGGRDRENYHITGDNTQTHI